MSSSKQRVKGESLHLHTTCRSRAEASQGDGDDGVVLERDSDHRCPSAERTAPPRATHVRLGRRLILLDPVRGEERLMKIQQYDGVVVDAAELRQGFAKQLREEEEVLQGGGRLQGLWVRPPLPPLPLYRRKRGGGRSLAPSSKEGVRPRGGRSPSSPRHLGGAFPLEDSSL